jgi:YVTN family beta-propeller protein
LEYQDGKLWVSLLQDNQVAVYAVKGGRLKFLAALKVGTNPTAFAADPARHRLYVMNQNSDEISVLDSLTLKKTDTWSLRQGAFKFGAAPTSGFVKGGRLYVTLSRTNAVAVLDTKDGRVEGYIPTGWYPTYVTGDENNLYTLSAKGIHERRPNPNGPSPPKNTRNPVTC